MNKIPIFSLYTLLLFGGMAGCFSSQAQDSTIGRVAIASPNAASLGKYGDIPISYNTGIPNISIPLYTIRSGSLQLPIGLSYHAGGLKVQEQASWVGAGWTLNAGGAITRTVVGAPDDRGIDAAHCTNGYFSDYGYSNYLFTAGGSSCGGTGVPCPVGSINGADDQGVMGGVKDGEPDLYFFNFNGHTGKFYFNDDRTPVIVPEEDFKIVPLYPYTTAQNSPIGILGFTITTPDGVMYYFGKNQSGDGNIDATEITTDLTSMAPSNTGQGAVSSWFLNKIVSADGTDSIKLIYQQDKLSYYALSMFPVPSNAGNSFFGSNYEYDLVKNFVNGVRLSQIQFANGEVDLTPGLIRQDVGDYNSMIIGDVANTQSAALGSIKITDNNGFCKKDSFYCSYFHDSINSTNGFFASNTVISAITSDTYRLRLDSVQEIACDGSTNVPPYRFSYFSELVPRKLAFGLDHWGFYNGVTSNQTLIPTYKTTVGSTPTTYSGADRDSHWPAMRGGALQLIKYPTGGTTQFDFEANDTWSSYTTSTDSSSGFSGGQDGHSSASAAYSTNSNTGTYMIVINNNTSGGATVSFTGGPSYGIVANVTDTFYYNFSPSTIYPISISISSPQTGHGISGTIFKFTTTTLSGNTMVGGLRIKTLTNTDGLTSNNIVTSYAYTNGGTQSSGILYSKPLYVSVARNDVLARIGFASGTICSSNGCLSCDGSSAQAYYKSPSSIRPMETTQGNHIGYNQVQVSQTGNGYSIYKYYGSDYWDNIISDVCIRDINLSSCSLSFPNYPAAPLPFESMRGELKYEAHYDQAGHILKDATYFPKYLQDSIFTPGLKIQTANTGVGTTAVMFGTEYTLQSAAKIKDSVVSTTYDVADIAALTTTAVSYYNSRYHHQLTRKVNTTSTGDSLATNFVYANDFRINNCDTISNGWDTYLMAYDSNTIHYSHLSDTCTNAYWNTGSWSCKFIFYQQERFNNATNRQAYVALQRNNHTDTGNRFAACLLTAENAADSLLKPILRLQDEYNNVPIETSDYKDQYLRHAGFTRYDTSQSPVGFAYPGKTQLVNLPAISSVLSDAAVSGNTITRDSRYKDETSYFFSQGNPLQVTPFNKVSTSYVWDYRNKFPVAKVINAAADQIASTSFEADGAGNWTIGSSSRDTTAAITGTNSYVLASDISKSGLNSAVIYIISYWTENNSPFSITGTLSSYPVKGKTVSINNHSWTLYVHKVTGQTSVTISGSGHIDELRLYPATAQMTTYTYSPLVGMTSQTDPGNRITYYEYDGLARLKRVRDQDYNILKSLEYQYQASGGCGGNCYSITMQTFAGTNTLSYPVGVFNIYDSLLGNATNAAGYISLWNADTADARIGTLAAGKDSLHFNITLNSGQTMPAGVTGCRYFQYDLAWNVLDGVENSNGVYVDYGDGTRMPLAKNFLDTPRIIAPNTTVVHYVDRFNNVLFLEHSYPDTSLKTITFYHNDATESAGLDNLYAPATSLTKLKNFRGNMPQYTTSLGGSCYQQASALSVANIANWNSINTVINFSMNKGDGITPCENLGYAQDFMKNNRGLEYAQYAGSYYNRSIVDSNFKISRLKSDWNTYFPNLQALGITEDMWNDEDLSAVPLHYFVYVAGNQNHNNDPTNNPVIPIPSGRIDTVINQIAYGTSPNINNGFIIIWSGGPNRTSASDSGIAALKAKGCTITINGVNQ